jgi:hypothetical protein
MNKFATTYHNSNVKFAPYLEKNKIAGSRTIAIDLITGTALCFSGGGQRNLVLFKHIIHKTAAIKSIRPLCPASIGLALQSKRRRHHAAPYGVRHTIEADPFWRAGSEYNKNKKQQKYFKKSVSFQTHI